jgi:hypothetical protein
VPTAKRHDAAALTQILVEHLLPLGAGGYTVLGVKIQEQRLVFVAAQSSRSRSDQALSFEL